MHMNTFLVFLILVVALLLGAVVLVQNPGGGLATGFRASQIGGAAYDEFLEKATWY